MATVSAIAFCGLLLVISAAPFYVAARLWWNKARILAIVFGGFGSLAVAFTFAASFAPNLLRPPSVKQERMCAGQLSAIRLAKFDWASKTKQPDTAIPQPSDLTAYLKDGALPVCPSGGTYTLGAVNERPRCSRHLSAHLPRAHNPQPSTAYACLGTYTLGAVNEPPRCSHADKGHTLTTP